MPGRGAGGSRELSRGIKFATLSATGQRAFPPALEIRLLRAKSFEALRAPIASVSANEERTAHEDVASALLLPGPAFRS